MASPFALFRKNQKIMMAVLGIMCMIGFVLTDSLSSLFTPGGGGGMGSDPDKKIVAVTDDLSLSERDVAVAVYNRQIVHQFLSRALAASVRKRRLLQLRQELKGESEEEVMRQLEMALMQIEGQVRMAVINSVGAADERSVVDNLVLADLAKKSGVQITDERIVQFVREFIAEFPFDPVEGEQLDAIVRSMQGVSERQLNDAIRTELLAGTMRDSWAVNPAFAPGNRELRIPALPVATPIDRWNYYTRQKLRATAEVVAVRTADIVKADKVGAPQERELVAFFDEYKFNEPVPGSPDPGFKIPQKAAFQYFAADEAAFMDTNKITPAEIAEHYEKNKARYPYTPEDFSEPVKKEEPKPTTSTTPATTTPASTAPAPAATPSATAPKPTASPSAGAPKPSATPTPSASAAPSASPSAPSPSAPSASAPSPASTAPKPAASPSASPSASKPAGGSCEAPEEDAELISGDCQAPTASASATPSATPTATPKPSASATPSASPSATPAAAPSATTAATSTPAATSNGAATPGAAPTASPSGTAAAATAAAPPPLPLPSEQVMLPDDVRTGKEPQYDPLWKVEEKIRKELAEAAVRKRIQTIFEELKTKMVDKSTSRPYEKSIDPKQPPLYSKDEWLALAKPYPGLVAVTTDTLSRLDVVAQADAPGLFHSLVGGVPFSEAAFSSHSTYAPQESIEVPATDSVEAILTHRKTVHYLFWKTVDIEAKVPELKDVRAEVELAWRTRAARDLARQEAAAMAKRVVESSKPMAELFPDKEVKLTNSFSWYKPDLSGGFGRQQPTEISEVDNVEDAGPEFMEAVFSLRDNEVTTAFNNPQTVCYVIRAVTISPPRENLYTTFLTDPFPMYMQYGMPAAERLARNSVETLLAQSGLKWMREPKPFDPNR